MNQAPADQIDIQDGQQLGELLDDIEQHLDQLRAWHERSDQFIQQWRGDRNRLDASRAQLDQRDAQLQEAQRSFETQREAFEDQRSAMTSQRAVMDEQKQQLEQGREQLEQMTRQLQQQQQQIDEVFSLWAKRKQSAEPAKVA